MSNTVFDQSVFAKVFAQIFDSSIAEDYNCRRMFMDLLVLADPTGAVDMTPEAISRRTNVPLEEVVKYIDELCQPDLKSRSALEEGKRLVRLDPERDWGWRIVNYAYYRKIKNQEALREYFREKQREHRAKKKRVKDNVLTDVDMIGQSLTSSHTPSSSYSVLKEGVRGRFLEWTKFRRGLGKKPKDWDAMFEKQAQWLTQFLEQDQLAILDQSIRNGWQGLFELRRNGSNGSKPMSAFEIEKRIQAIGTEINRIFKKNGNQRVPLDGIDNLKQRRDELQKQLVT